MLINQQPPIWERTAKEQSVITHNHLLWWSHIQTPTSGCNTTAHFSQSSACLCWRHRINESSAVWIIDFFFELLFFNESSYHIFVAQHYDVKTLIIVTILTEYSHRCSIQSHITNKSDSAVLFLVYKTLLINALYR